MKLGNELAGISTEFMAEFLAENGDAVTKLGVDTVKAIWAEQVYRRLGIPALSESPSAAELADHAAAIQRRSMVIALLAQAEMNYRAEVDALRAVAFQKAAAFLGTVGLALLKGLA